jgi:hypothetical protein
LKILAANLDLCLELGEKGHENFVKKFHIGSVAQKVLGIYEELVPAAGF